MNVFVSFVDVSNQEKIFPSSFHRGRDTSNERRTEEKLRNFMLMMTMRRYPKTHHHFWQGAERRMAKSKQVNKHLFSNAFACLFISMIFRECVHFHHHHLTERQTSDELTTDDKCFQIFTKHYTAKLVGRLMNNFFFSASARFSEMTKIFTVVKVLCKFRRGRC